MKTVVQIFSILSMVMFTISCGPKLETDEAATLVSEHFGFPKPKMSSFHDSLESEFAKGVHRLLSEGVIVDNPAHNPINPTSSKFLPTEKGEGFVEKIKTSYWHYGEGYSYHGVVVQQTLKSIDEILVDEKNNEAFVTYTTAIEPLEPYYSMVCVTKACPFLDENSFETEQKTIKVKKYDKGWRVPVGVAQE